MPRRERPILLAGFGGQGLLFAGQVLAQAALDEGRGVLWIPSYGPEMRGGTASCTVIVAEGPVGSPAVDRYEGVIALNAPSAAKFASRVAAGGALVLNAEAAGDAAASGADVLALPLVSMAMQAGNGGALSVVALAALCARLGIVERASLEGALRRIVAAKHPEALAADLAALDLGWDAGARSAVRA